MGGGWHQRSKQRAVEVLSDEHRLLSVYDTHFFPHANVDMLRLRFLTRSLLKRVSHAIRRAFAAFREKHADDTTGNTTGNTSFYYANRMQKLMIRNYDRYGDALNVGQFCMRTLIHVCEYIICKTDGLLLETTDSTECSRRAHLKRNIRDVCSLEVCVLTLVGWHVFDDMDGLIRLEEEAEEKEATEKEVGKEECSVRFIKATSNKDHRRINHRFVRVQKNYAVGVRELLRQRRDGDDAYDYLTSSSEEEEDEEEEEEEDNERERNSSDASR